MMDQNLPNFYLGLSEYEKFSKQDSPVLTSPVSALSEDNKADVGNYLLVRMRSNTSNKTIVKVTFVQETKWPNCTFKHFHVKKVDDAGIIQQ